jgi:hypothetical protein
MIAYLVFTSWEPFLVMTSRDAVHDGRLVEGLGRMGFEKFIAREVPIDSLRARYGVPFEVIEKEVKEGKDVRVLDYKGEHVFKNVLLDDLGTCIRHEAPHSSH